MHSFPRAVIAVLTLLSLNLSFAATQAVGQERVHRKLMIGTRHVPPFAIHAEDGSWKGISIDLWREIAGEVDAVVYDDPILRYLVNKELRAPLRVLPRVFEPQSYAIALPPGSTLREPINRLVLQRTTEPEWRDLLYRYLGE